MQVLVLPVRRFLQLELSEMEAFVNQHKSKVIKRQVMPFLFLLPYKRAYILKIVYASVWRWVCVWRPEDDLRCCPLGYHPSPWIQGCSWHRAHQLVHISQPGSHRDPAVPASPALVLQEHVTMPGISCMASGSQTQLLLTRQTFSVSLELYPQLQTLSSRERVEHEQFCHSLASGTRRFSLQPYSRSRVSAGAVYICS